MAKTKEYGTTPWGQWFLEMLSCYNFSARLQRGKTYANTGKVQSIVVKERSVAAKVKGSYSPWYHVYFHFPPLSSTNKKNIETALIKNPAALAGLRSGIMSGSLIETLKKKKVKLIPANWNLIKRECSCPDTGDPCKHMAAVLFILAKEIDHDPRLLFELAGFDLKGINLEENIEVIDIRQEDPIPQFLKTKYKNKKTEFDNNKFNFQLKESYLTLITKVLPQNPSFSSSDFIIKLTEFYHTAILHYGMDFYKTERIKSTKKTVNPFLFAKIKINMPEISKDIFPLAFEKYLTASVQIAEREPVKMTLMQMFNFFCNKTNYENISRSCKTLFVFYSLAGKLIQSSAFIPAIFENNKNISIFWKPLLLSSEIREDIENFCELIDNDFFPFSEVWGKFYSANILLTALLTEFIHSIKFIPKFGLSSDKEIDNLFFLGYSLNINVPGKRNLGKVIYSWLSVLNYAEGKYGYRLILKETNREDFFSLSAFVRKIPNRPQKSIDINNFKLEAEEDCSFIELYKAAKKIKNTDEVFRLPAVLSSYLPAFANLAAKKEIFISVDDTGNFLQNSAKLLNRFGIDIVLPKSLKNILVPKPVIKIEKAKGAGNVVSFLNMNDIITYDKAIMLGENILSYEEFQKIFLNKTGLVKFNDRFILLNAEEVAKMFSEFRKPANTNEALQAVFSGDAVCSEPALKILDSIFKETEISVPKTLNASLRPYQEKGFRWLYANIKSGFGCLLADDMGLGKTIQIITFILACKNSGEPIFPVLIIAPASLISNWEHEIKKFAPSLDCRIYHGYRRKFFEKSDVIITTYQTAQKDSEKLKTKKISCIVLDEAQAIKNSEAKKSKAIKQLDAKGRIALTGTPVENNLEDMRSIFDFILPGYLGSSEYFKKTWRIPIELHGLEDTAEKLKKITAPFLLRRLKTDPKIISDLPEKIITNQYCNLTPEQLALYENLVQTELDKVIGADTKIERQAQVLKLLTLLKQVCNHPCAYDKTVNYDVLRSGKTIVLMELLKDIFLSGEKVIIFSQYVGTLEILKTMIRKELDSECLILHGQMSAQKRKQAVDLFQNESAYRIFLISLKAGGTGLNLTAANRVIHFDLWYNPAVEDQATDRAFRIGQKKNVFVHRFICLGTFEEKIDAMIQKKREISGMTISSGETWISKLTDDELVSLFKK